MPKDRKFYLLLIAVSVVLVAEVFSLTGHHLPMPWAPVVFAAFVLGVGHEVLRKGVKALFQLRFSSINLLMVIAVVGAFYLGEYSEAAVVITLYVLGEKLENIGIERSKSALDTLVSSIPRLVVVKGVEGPVRIDQVAVGSIILVRPGEMIPLDGVVVEGRSAVDEATITGEPLPQDKSVDDKVYGGTLNKLGALEVRTTRTNSDTTLTRIVQLTYQAQANRSRTQRFIERFARVYTPCVLVVAVLLVVVPVLFLGKPFDPWFEQAITILVIACPCALVISTPVAIYSAIGNAGGRGAVVKGGLFLEALATVRAVGLDKTRTITFGRPVVEDVTALGDTTREELLSCAAGAEALSEHPLAQCIVDRARAEGFEPHRVTGFSSTMGRGITAQCTVCDHDHILIGSLDHVGAQRTVRSDAQAEVDRLRAQGKTVVVVSFGQELGGVIGIADAIKPDSARAVAGLQAIGVEAVMLTGDNQQAAAHVAKQVGIAAVHGGLLPEDKAACIRELQRTKGPVAFVGDGVNDAPALATADVGIAMGALGSDTAVETAGVALMNDDVRMVPWLIRLARATLARIRINTVLAVGVKFLFLLLAFLGMSHLVLAIAADVGVTLLVILTSLRLMRWDGTA